jgi:ribosomal protein S18 acetylase RimI-like enzyme
MNSLKIIPATPDDIPALLAFMERFYAIDHYDFQFERTKKALHDFIADERLGRIWMISVDHLPIGYIILAYNFCFEFGGRNAFIDELYLEKEHRGKGIGRKVVEYVIEEAKKMNIAALHLEVEHQNITAAELYRKFGFTDHHRILMTRMLTDNVINTKKE